VGLKTLLFTLVLSSISVLIGVTLANLVKPGAGLSETSRAALMDIMGKSAREIQRPPEPKAGLQIFLDLIPQNPVEAMVNAFRGDILAVMVFALFLGIAVTLLDRKKVEPLLVWLQAMFDVVMKVIDIAMRLAPTAWRRFFTLMARSADVPAKLGLYAHRPGGLAPHQFVTYS
jgi:DAACS family dicarboxylate/amino acid:cation (Na+ or H+) symporter